MLTTKEKREIEQRKENRFAIVRVRTKPEWNTAVKAGLIGGAVFLAAELILVPLLTGGSPWGPVQMIAAIFLGEAVLPPPASFSWSVLLAAAVVHFLLSGAYGIVMAPLVHNQGPMGATLVGIVAGLILYIINFYGFTYVFDWFVAARNPITLFSHVLFGGVTAYAYKKMWRRGLERL